MNFPSLVNQNLSHAFSTQKSFTFQKIYSSGGLYRTRPPIFSQTNFIHFYSKVIILSQKPPMSQDTFVKYQIQDSKSYRGSGDIQDIKNTKLNRVFQLYSDSDNQFKLDLRFEAPTIIVQINMRLMNVHRFQLQLVDNKNNVVEEIKKVNSSKDDQIVLMPNVLEPVRYAKLKIMKSALIDKRLGIRYIIFKGINDQVQKKPQSKTSKSPNAKNNHTLETFFQKKSNPRKDPRTFQSKEMFNNREKQKAVKEEVEKLIDFSDFDKEFSLSKEKQQRGRQSLLKPQHKLNKKVKKSQQDSFLQQSRKSYQRHKHQQQLQKQTEKQQTQLAIALSRSEHQLQQQQQQMQQLIIDEAVDSRTMKMDQEEEPLPAALEDYLKQNFSKGEMQEEQEIQRVYQTMEFNQDYIQFFSDMSPEWLAAQKRAEILHNVKEQQRISNFIRIKWLYNTQVYIQGFEDWRLDQLRHQARSLGCKLLDQLKNNCIAIVSRSVGEKLRKRHKDWKEVKYLTPNYLEDCIQKQERLNFRGYYANV